MGAVISPCSLQRVIVVPRNGYANRLQAWASSAILAAELDASLEVCWVPESVAGAQAHDLFAPELVDRQFISEAMLEEHLGRHINSIPRYLTLDTDNGIVVLAGHDQGEQYFMPDLTQMLNDDSQPHTLVVVAGGKFHLPWSTDFVRQRAIFYQRLSWSPELDAAVADAVTDHTAFSALHIRETDRSREAPPRHTIKEGLRALAASGAPSSLFIAADSPKGRETWVRESSALGFQPWTRATVTLDRADPRAGIDALADWRVMSRAEAIVHPRASTFSEEASVASGHHDRAIPLSASMQRQRLRAAAAATHSALTYPQRNWRR